MSEEPYNKREMDNFITHIKSSLGRIEVTVDKTNGRVSSLEKWRWALTGAMAVISFLVTIGFINIMVLK